MTALLENSLFAGRYRVVRCIAAGGMGAVYEVVHLETERRRALKVMLPHFVKSPELRERFKLEARVAAQIDSEFIVDVFDAGIEETTEMPFLVMELLKGEELGKRLERVGRFAPPEAITYLWQTALALDKTHKANIVHRDLKPENLFLTQREDGPPRVKVLDFGVAKFIAEAGAQGGATRSLGTPLYMAPEQFRAQAVSSASDNFALAMMAFTLMVGETYWAREADAAGDVIAFAMMAAVGPIEPATERAARRGVTLPAAFDAWFARATATDPSRRFPTATATIGALAQGFGLNPASMTGAASSDPLPSLEVSRTQPLGSGGPHTSAVGSSAPAIQTVVAGGTTIGSVGVTMGRSPVGERVSTIAPPKSSMGVAIVTLGVMSLLGVGVGVYFYKRSSIEPQKRVDSSLVAPASPAGEPTASSLTTTATVVSAASSDSTPKPPKEPPGEPSASASTLPKVPTTHPGKHPEVTAPVTEKPTASPAVQATPTPPAYTRD